MVTLTAVMAGVLWFIKERWPRLSQLIELGLLSSPWLYYASSHHVPAVLRTATFGVVTLIIFALCWFTSERLRLGVRYASAVILLPSIIVFAGPLIRTGRQAENNTQSVMASASGSSILISSVSHVPLSVPTPKHRFVWLLFDEIDYHLTWEARGYTGPLPAFDSLRSVSISATSAHPTNYWTLAAVPSMLSGRTMSVEAALKAPGLWSHPTVFTELTSAHHSTGILGWYHPYCEALASSVTACISAQWPEEPIAGYLDSSPAGGRILPDIRWLYANTPMGEMHFRHDEELAHTAIYDTVKRQTQSFLSAELDFVFIHLPIPHLPGIGSGQGQHTDYIDNLRMADEVLGNAITTLKQAGQWEYTTLLVSGDHHLRTSLGHLSERVRLATQNREDPRTVFLLKMAGQNTHAIAYTAPFDLLQVHDLILNVILKRLRSPDDVVRWMASRPRPDMRTVPKD